MSEAGVSAKGHGLLCPACRVNLVMSERQSIEIDYCPQCRGVWLDRGELDKIIERSLGDTNAAPTNTANAPWGGRSGEPDRHERGHGHGHGHGDSHGYGHGSSRHRSFLGRLFD